MTADEFNTWWGVGTTVLYWPGERRGPGVPGLTRSPASTLADGTPVVWIQGQGGCVALSHVQVPA